jgi:hypothetical protein
VRPPCHEADASLRPSEPESYRLDCSTTRSAASLPIFGTNYSGPWNLYVTSGSIACALQRPHILKKQDAIIVMEVTKNIVSVSILRKDRKRARDGAP